MKKFEYARVLLFAKDDNNPIQPAYNPDEVLKQMGLNGFELVSVANEGLGCIYIIAYFKREIL